MFPMHYMHKSKQQYNYFIKGFHRLPHKLTSVYGLQKAYYLYFAGQNEI